MKRIPKCVKCGHRYEDHKRTDWSCTAKNFACRCERYTSAPNPINKLW